MEVVLISIIKQELETIVTNAVQMALDKSTEANVIEPEEKYFTTATLLEYLSIKKSTLYQLTHHKLIPYNKKGRLMYFKKEDIDNWVLQGKQLTKEEERRKRDLKLSSLQNLLPLSIQPAF